MLQDVMREHIAPRDERDKNNNHQDGFDIFCRRGIDLVGRPKWERKGYEIYRLPDHLEQQYRQHLHWISKSQCGGRAEASQQGDLNSRWPSDEPGQSAARWAGYVG